MLAGNDAFAKFEQAVEAAQQENEWFTEENICMSLSAIANEFLNESKLHSWLSTYANMSTKAEERIGIVAAGNIPLVCFHDILCVILSGNQAVLKPSSKDKVLITEVVRLLGIFNVDLSKRLELVDSIDPSSVDRLIATGSDNTARYVEYTYRGLPILLRKSRSSLAVLTGKETADELRLLAADVFSYFGMGCRNVSKLYVPENYDFSFFIGTAHEWSEVLTKHKKYTNSYCYQKALYLSLDETFLDGKFFLIKQSNAYTSPLSTLYFDFYSGLDELKMRLVVDAEQLQCVVAANGNFGNVCFGQTQYPALADYADGIDCMRWLMG